MRVTSIDTFKLKEIKSLKKRIDTSLTIYNQLIYVENKLKDHHLKKKWLFNLEEIEWYEMKSKFEKEKILLGFAFNRQSTGLRSNFYDAIIINYDRNLFYEFITLSNDPKLFFFDNKSILNFFRVDYSTEFINTKNWDEVILEIIKYQSN